MLKLAFLSKKSKASLRKSLFIYFIVFAIIPTIIVSFIYSYFSTNYIDKVTTQLGISMIDRTSTEMETLFSTIIRVGDIAANNQRIQQSLRMNYMDNLALRYGTDLDNDAELNFANYLQPEILGLNVLGDNHNEFKSHNRTFINQDHASMYWYKKIRESNEYIWFPPHVGQYATISAGEVVISCGRKIVDKVTGAVTGVVLIDVREDVLRDIVSTKLGESGYILILDEYNNVIYSPSGLTGSLINLSKLIGDKKEGTMVTSIHMDGFNLPSERVITAYKEIPLTGWKLMGIIPVKSINKWNDVLSLMIILVLVGTLIIAFFEAFSLSNKVTDPLRNLIKAMKKVEKGDLGFSIEEKGYEEVAELSRNFNKMIEEIELLISNTYDEHKKLRKAELKALQAQINPHFLYNTFDSILWLNRDGMRDEVQTLVESLTTFFRIGISKGRDIISLREELEHVESYLKIQHIRYSNKFDYSINVDEKLLNFQIPKLILQPLVENAIYHGVKLLFGKGHIFITGKEKDEEWEIVVTDTGKGMSEERLEILNSFIKDNQNTDSDIYGVRNVNERLKIIFGDKASMHYKNNDGGGTTVTVTLPKSGYTFEE